MGPSSTSELRDALLASYPDAAYYGAPVARLHRDDTQAAWTWLMGLVCKRSDWWPAIGIALQHAAQDGGDPARIALADFLESFQHTIVLLQWTEPLDKQWPDAVATCRGTGWGEPDYRLTTILAGQRKLWDMCKGEVTVAVEGAGEGGEWLIADVKTQADLESVLVTTAKVGKHGGPWHWLLSALLFRSALEPMVVDACAKFASGTDAEVRAMLDWLYEEHDRWRYVDLLETWSRTKPAWWNASADTIPPGWRFPIRDRSAKTLGEAALRVLERARTQSSTKITNDLAPIFGGGPG